MSGSNPYTEQSAIGETANDALAAEATRPIEWPSTALPGVLTALAALVKLIPGYEERHVNVNLHCCDAATLAAFVDAGAVSVRYANELKTEEWNVAELNAGGVNISAFGRHRAIATVETES